MELLKSKKFISELLSKIDIKEIIGSRVELEDKGDKLIGCCPFHAEHTPSFVVNKDKKIYHCFGCSAHGNAIDFVIKFDRINPDKAIKKLAQQFKVDVPNNV